MSAMYKQDYLKAEKYFLQFTDNFRGSNYIKSAYHKLYHISILTNSIEKQEKYKYLVLNKGNSLIDEDRRAEDEIKNNPRSRSAKLRYVIKKRDFYDFDTDVFKKFKTLLEIENFGKKLWVNFLLCY